MNVKAISSVLISGCKSLKTLPTAGKVGIAAMFGAGMLTGSLLCCDGFEREQKTEVKEKTELVTNPQADLKVTIESVQEFDHSDGKGKLVVDTYPSGQVKKIFETDEIDHNRITKEFNEDGTPKSELYQTWNDYGSGYRTSKEVSYYPSGQVKKIFETDEIDHNRITKEFNQDGTPKSELHKKWDGYSWITAKEIQ